MFPIFFGMLAETHLFFKPKIFQSKCTVCYYCEKEFSLYKVSVRASIMLSMCKPNYEMFQSDEPFCTAQHCMYTRRQKLSTTIIVS